MTLKLSHILPRIFHVCLPNWWCYTSSAFMKRLFRLRIMQIVCCIVALAGSCRGITQGIRCDEAALFGETIKERDMDVCLLISCFQKSCPKFKMSWPNCFHAACVFLVLTFTRNTDKHMLRNSAENISSCNKASFIALLSADRREVLCN